MAKILRFPSAPGALLRAGMAEGAQVRPAQAAPVEDDETPDWVDSEHPDEWGYEMEIDKRIDAEEARLGRELTEEEMDALIESTPPIR